MNECHILSLSGGKDSTALAFFIKENMPEIHKKIEYVFCDTECELPGTYDYLNKIEIFLEKPILRLKPDKSFEHLMEVQSYFPSPIKRWCTVELKAKPFEKYIKNLFQIENKDIVYLYIGIRADELKRAKYNKYNNQKIKEVYPFVDNGIMKNDVLDILSSSGIGLPDYYKWSNRSGCYFCPFQTKMNWLNLHKFHPDLFLKAKKYEDEKNPPGCNFKRVGWNLDLSLEDILKNKEKIIEDYKRKQEKIKSKLKKDKLIDRF